MSYQVLTSAVSTLKTLFPDINFYTFPSEYFFLLKSFFLISKLLWDDDLIDFNMIYLG